MAENEYLDASRGFRWRQVAEAICERLGAEEATGRALDSLLKTLRHAGKEIPLSDMLQAIESTSELQRLIEPVRGAEDITSTALSELHLRAHPRRHAWKYSLDLLSEAP